MLEALLQIFEKGSTWSLSRPLRRQSVLLTRLSLLQLLSAIYQRHESSHSIAPQDYLELYASEEQGRHARLTRRLANRLREGLTLADALEQTPELLSDDEVLAIRLASQSGTVPETLLGLQEEYRLRSAEEIDSVKVWKHLVSVGIKIDLIILLQGAIALPNLSQMFEEFDIPPPRLLQLAMDLRVIAAVIALPIIIAISLVGWALASRLGLARWLRRRLGSFLFRSQFVFNSAKTLQLISQGMRRGRPAAGILSTLARYHHDARIRHQLLHMRNELELGSELSEELCKAGLASRSTAVALATLDSNADQGWMLGKIADRTLSRIAHFRQIVTTLLHTGIYVVYGLITLLFCAATIQGLATMTEVSASLPK